MDRFDPERGVAFSSYAVPTILGELKRHFRDKGYAVHLPRGLQKPSSQVPDATAELSRRTGSSPSAIMVAEHLSTRPRCGAGGAGDDHRSTRRIADESIDPSDPGADAITRHDVVGSEDDGYALVEMSAGLAAAAKHLPALDRRVLALRFRDDLKQREIAERIGVSQMQVSRILRRAADQLRHSTQLV